MRAAYFLQTVFLFISCTSISSDEIDLNSLVVPQGQAYIQSKSIKKEISEILEYSGMRSYGKHNIKLNTINSHYFFFAAVVDIPKSESGGYSSSDAVLSSVKRFNGCFIYELCKDTTNINYVEEELNLNILVDEKTSSILNNDSLYISIHGRDYETMPEEMSIGSWKVNEFDNQYFDLGSIVPIFSGTVYKPADKDRDVSSFFMIGLVSYDRTHKYDFDSMFNSAEFASRVAFPYTISDYSQGRKKLYIRDYIITDI